MGYEARRSKRYGYRLIQYTYADGERTTETVPREALKDMGFDPGWSFEEADARAKQLNAMGRIEYRKNVATARIADLAKLSEHTYLPDQLKADFEKHLRKKYKYNKNNRIKTVLQHWATCQRIITKFAIDPDTFHAHQDDIFAHFIEEEYSADYAGKLIHILNEWGFFVSEHRKSFFKPIERPNIEVSAELEAKRANKKHVRREAKPLTFSQLNAKKSDFENNGIVSQWFWLKIALAFGLRPQEVDNLHPSPPKTYWVEEFDSENQVKIIKVLQTKLSKLPEAKRWKVIPVYTPEQEAALRLIKAGNFKRPLAKTVSNHFGEGYDCYSPRKGFTDWMLELGFALEDVSQFLGHSSIQTTWSHYKNKTRFKLPKKAA